jgi:ribosome-binding protein aMBF1 (putative translation factor)
VQKKNVQCHQPEFAGPQDQNAFAFSFKKKAFAEQMRSPQDFFFERKLSSRFLNHIREMRQGTGCCSSDLASKLKHPKGQEPLCKSASKILLIPTQNQKESCAPHFDSVHLCS